MIEVYDIDHSYDDDNDNAEESFNIDSDISETFQPVTPSTSAECKASSLNKAIKCSGA